MKRIKNYKEVREALLPHLHDYLINKGIKFKNKKFNCLSPTHTDAHASCSIHPDGKKYICFSCEASGSIIDAYAFLEHQDITGKNYFEALQELATRFNVNIEYEETYYNSNNDEYFYYNADRSEYMKTTRYTHKDGKKDFYVYTIIDGEYEAGLNGKEPILYNYPDVIDSIDNGKTIFLVEGEKSVNILKRKYGVVGTTIYGGAKKHNKWFKKYAENLKNSTIICVPDNDIIGEEFMQSFVDNLKSTAKSLKMVYLKDLFEEGEFPHKGDIEEFVEMNGNLDRVYQKAMESTELSEYKNYIFENDKGKRTINRNLLALYLTKKHNIIKMEDGTMRIYSEDNGYMIEVDDLNSYVRDEIDSSLVTFSLLDEVMKLWKTGLPITKYIDVDKKLNLINLRNGLYNTLEDKLTPHDKDYLSTVQLDLNYNNKAVGKKFDNFMKRTFPDLRWREIVQEMFGYILSGQYGLRDIFILHGPSFTGKSQLTDVLYSMFNSENRIAISIAEMSKRFQISQFFGKNICISGDVTGNKINNSSTLKTILSDNMNSEVKHIKKNLDFKYKGKIVVTTNKIIDFDESDDSVTNRLFYIPCLEVTDVEERIIRYSSELEDEKEYIFIWAMVGLKRLMTNNFRFSHNDLIEEHREEQVRFLNPVREFVEEVIEYDVNSEESFADLFIAFKKYLNRNLIDDKYEKDKFSKNLAKELEVMKTTLGYNNGRKRGYQGIKLIKE